MRHLYLFCAVTILGLIASTPFALAGGEISNPAVQWIHTTGKVLYGVTHRENKALSAFLDECDIFLGMAINEATSKYNLEKEPDPPYKRGYTYSTKGSNWRVELRQQGDYEVEVNDAGRVVRVTKVYKVIDGSSSSEKAKLVFDSFQSKFGKAQNGPIKPIDFTTSGIPTRPEVEFGHFKSYSTDMNHPEYYIIYKGKPVIVSITYKKTVLVSAADMTDMINGYNAFAGRKEKENKSASDVFK